MGTALPVDFLSLKGSLALCLLEGVEKKSALRVVLDLWIIYFYQRGSFSLGRMFLHSCPSGLEWTNWSGGWLWIIVALAWDVEGRSLAEMPASRQQDQLAVGVVQLWIFSLAKPQPPWGHRQSLKFAGPSSLFHSTFSFVSYFSPSLSLQSLHFKLFFSQPGGLETLCSPFVVFLLSFLSY